MLGKWAVLLPEMMDPDGGWVVSLLFLVVVLLAAYVFFIYRPPTKR
jgi:hypothetical protein